MKNKVLIIEDDAVVSRIFQSLITKKAFADVSVAVTSEEGLRKLESEKPSLLIIDMFLNNQPTLETIKKVKKSEMYQSLPIIVFTVIGDKENMESLKALGVKDFIIKGSTSMGEALSLVSKALN